MAADYVASRAAGRRTALSAEQMARTAADGLRVQQVGALPWDHLQAFVDDVVTVSEVQIRDAVRQIRVETGLVAEPSGAVSVAAATAAVTARGRSGAALHVPIVTGSNADQP